MSGSDDSGDFPDNEEEEDRKPSIEYLDSLNAYRKRSRSREDEGAVKKVAKVNGCGYPVPAVPVDMEVEVESPVAIEVVPADDPVVYGKVSSDGLCRS
jgi:transcription initiation factor TFIIE subunit alpha